MRTPSTGDSKEEKQQQWLLPVAGDCLPGVGQLAGLHLAEQQLPHLGQVLGLHRRRVARAEVGCDAVTRPRVQGSGS